jgi:hypothetical protein
VNKSTFRKPAEQPRIAGADFAGGSYSRRSTSSPEGEAGIHETPGGTPELVGMVDRGELAVSGAAAIAQLPAEEQEELVGCGARQHA